MTSVIKVLKKGFNAQNERAVGVDPVTLELNQKQTQLTCGQEIKKKNDTRYARLQAVQRFL